MEQTYRDQRVGEGDNGGKKGKGLDREHVWMTHGHGQVWDWLWESGVDSMEDGKGGKFGTTVIIIKNFKKEVWAI